MNKKRLCLILLLLLFASSVLCSAKPRGWAKVGAIDGLLGDDWFEKKTTHTRCYAKEVDLDYVDQVVVKLDSYYQVNATQLGFRAQGPFNFYFCPMSEPGSAQPKFRRAGGGNPNSLGFAIKGTKDCVINLGLATYARQSTVYDMQVTSCHEMNHLFMFQVPYQDYSMDMEWFLEGLAHAAEESAKPYSARMDPGSMKRFLKGFQVPYRDFIELVQERNAPDNYNSTAYGQYLRSIIYFIEGRYGKGKIAALVRALPGRSLMSCLQSELGVKSAEELFQEWKKYYAMK